MEPDRALLLGVDLGATNCRVSIQPVDGSTLPRKISKFECHSASSFLKSLAALYSCVITPDDSFASQHQDVAPHGKIRAACIAAAGPVAVGGTAVSITNWPITDQEILLSALPKSIFPEGMTKIGNDMEAGAMGLAALDAAGKLQEAFKPLWKFESAASSSISLIPGAQHLVLAVGTGLGVASLSNGTVLPMEGCHARLVPCAPLAPEAESERKLFAYLSSRIWKGEHAPEWEDVCSGRGIVHVYDWLVQVDHTTSANLSPARIVQMAREHGCEESLKAVQTHYKFLARFSQYFVAVLQAKAVFWMGENLVSNMDLVDKFSGDLKKEFLHSSKPQWVQHCPIYVQTKKENFNMLGALYMAKGLCK